MTTTVSPTESEIGTILRSFLLDVLPAGTEVFVGQVNRVPEPAAQNFVVFTPIRRPRLATNVDDAADCSFTASIAGTVMTVASVQLGAIAVGAQVFGTGLASGTTTVTALGTGTGGTGTYVVSLAQAAASQPMAAGRATKVQETEIVYQLDVHGPLSGDNAQRISTMFRDAYAVDFFAALSSAVSPLYADDPVQAPFVNAEEQYEYRWTIEACVQANETVSGIPQQFADVVGVTLVEVDATYPP